MMGIYYIKNTINNKIYVGQSINIERRLYVHMYLLNKNQHCNTFLQMAWNEYKEENFTQGILEEVKEYEELNEREKYYVKKFSSNDYHFGYNLTEGGEGKVRNMQTIEKIKISSRGKNTTLTEDTVRQIKMAMWCGIDRGEISKMYSVSPKVLTAISQGKNFYYILSYLNEDLSRAKEKMLESRNNYILEVFDKEKSIVKTCIKTGYTTSIVEKCVYKHRDSVKKRKEKYQNLYDQALELYAQGLSKTEIASRLKIGYNTVYRYVNGINNPYNELPFKKITEKSKIEIADLYFNQHIEIYKIAQKYGVTRNTIEAVINHFKYVNTEISMETKESMPS